MKILEFLLVFSPKGLKDKETRRKWREPENPTESEAIFELLRFTYYPENT